MYEKNVYPCPVEDLVLMNFFQGNKLHSTLLLTPLHAATSFGQLEKLSWLMGDEIGSGLLSMAVCFDFCSTNVVIRSMSSTYGRLKYGFC